MNNNHLIVFVKQPAMGMVKTRIAQLKGDDIALKVYTILLEKTKDILENTNCFKHLFVEGEITYFQNSQCNTIHKQSGLNLGEKMSIAFETIFNLYQNSNCIIIGSDCYELTSTMIEEAFDKLNKNDYVIGPANDGGYYLLGMKKLLPALFQNIDWSTNKVFAQTIKHMSHFTTLPALNDIDLWEDVINNQSLFEKIK